MESTNDQIQKIFSSLAPMKNWETEDLCFLPKSLSAEDL